jgi:SAM-dependent methyltransferase
MTENGWLKMIENNPGHSTWYIERFRSMAEAGDDLHGEARMIDALISRQARVLDAGCGTGRVGGRLAHLGHQVVGVDLDPVLIAEAEGTYPEVTWLVADLAEFEFGSTGADQQFDCAVSAGNVMTFLDPATRQDVLTQILAHLAPTGRAVFGFGAGRGYEFEDFFADCAAVGFREQLRLSSWDLCPFDESSEFLVSVVST